MIGSGAYDVACEFIRLHDIMCLMQAVGIEPSIAMQQELGACRHVLDEELSARVIPTRAQWNENVRRRLTAAA